MEARINNERAKFVKFQKEIVDGINAVNDILLGKNVCIEYRFGKFEVKTINNFS